MPDLSIESKYPEKIIAGVDEAGRGPLAGPVVAGAVIVNQNNIIAGIRDSKQLTANAREFLYQKITNSYIWAVGIVPPAEIDRINILEATKKACELAVNNLSISPEVVIIDGNMKFDDPRFISYIKGDDLSVSIAAASIVAKVTRDRIMTELAEDFPQYLWHKNSGYGTKAHLQAIAQYGFSPHHRRSFRVQL